MLAHDHPALRRGEIVPLDGQSKSLAGGPSGAMGWIYPGAKEGVNDQVIGPIARG
jgi:hypothetical protein